MAREMKDSGIEWIGEIPKEWKLARMKTCILQRDSGAWGNEANGDEGDIICLRIADFNYPMFRFKDTEEELLTKRNYNAAVIENLLLQKNDIIIEKSGGGEKTPVGRTVIFDKSYRAVYANFCDRLRCRDIVLPQFMQYIFVTFYANRYIWNYIKQTTGIQNLDLTAMLSSEKIALPPIAEQQKIIDFLHTYCAELDNVLEKTRASIEEYKKLKQAIITQAVTKGIRGGREMKDSGIEWIGEIPVEWEERRIKTLFSLRDEKNFLPLEEINLISLYTDLGVVQHSELEKTTGNKASNADGYKMVYKDDIVVNIILCWMGAIGRSEYNGVTSPAYDIYIPQNGVLSKFYHYYFRTKGFSGDCYKRGKGIMAMRWRTYSDQFRDIKVVYPSYKEQQEIVTYLDQKCSAIDELIAKKEQYLSEIENYKKSIIYEYVTGKKEVPQEHQT
ncbi:MAG: restriction endonuclease subunit S [Ruminococcus flavefaciens]|nr:restriction endonuclease subunit S [Ruminococcus flavefaciens]